jgi:hypothetical protein
VITVGKKRLAGTDRIVGGKADLNSLPVSFDVFFFFFCISAVGAFSCNAVGHRRSIFRSLRTSRPTGELLRDMSSQ